MTSTATAFTYGPEILRDFSAAAALEWLEANGLGGWAGSTVAGAHSRRYHGLLVAATRPPVGRTVVLSKLDETLQLDDGQRLELGTNRFPDGTVHPRGHQRLRSFRKGLFPVWEFQAGGVHLEKTVVAVDGENTTLVLYRVLAAPAEFTLELRPLVAGRDYHALTHANGSIRREADFAGGVLRHRPYDGLPELALTVPGSEFVPGPDWWLRFTYDLERERGLDFEEDLFTPGVLRVRLAAGGRLGVVASTAGAADAASRDAFALADGERRRRQAVLARLPAGDPLTTTLGLALDPFVVRRGSGLRSLIAGYPWFGDWGRDTMISLPALCAAGRSDDAGRILRAFAASASQGMLPNRFPDSGEQPEFNTVDATLWFFIAIDAYLRAGGDEMMVRGDLLPVLADVVAWHERGTRFHIHVAPDGLLAAGEPGVQLTWMDAKVGDWVVTPRHGKPVEVNALWYNALVILAALRKRFGDAEAAAGLMAKARRVRHRFKELFWNDQAGCLYDVVAEDGTPDRSIRPNQLLALSLPHPLLGRDRGRRVLAVVEEKLVTPVGLRSLAPDDRNYRPVYQGGVVERDGAYHQGTVWAWLLGPYVSALLRYRGAAGRRQARRVLEGLRPHLAAAGVGTVSEIFDGDPPHAPRGCFAQAWSVAELLRAHHETMAAEATAGGEVAKR